MSADKSKILNYIGEAIKRPLAILPAKLAIIADVLEGRIGLDASDLQQLVDQRMIAYVNAPKASRFVGEHEPADPDKPFGKRKPYRTANGTAIINVIGSLVNRGAWINSASGMTSYEGLRYSFGEALKDGSVKSILLDIDSPGGEAIGMTDLGEYIATVNKTKPVYASVTGLCCSAAYGLAVGARRITVSSTSIVGSIGVVAMHVDRSQQLHQAGVKPTLIFAGAHKVDGNPFEPLTSGVRADIQSDVDEFYEKFVKHVSAHRDGLTPRAVRNTEARTFVGSDAVGLGLADAVGSFEDALASAQRRRTKMADDNDVMYSAEQHRALVSAEVTKATQAAAEAEGKRLTAEHQAAVATAVAEATKAERARIKAITSLDEAKGREALALTIATTTAQTADEAKALLAASPKAVEQQSSTLGLMVEKPNGSQSPAAGNHGWDEVTKEVNARYK